ncbi:MAG: chloride channel protein, partial [Clostridium sp.]|nr:chloride channel protein [Clostridium sp.]
GLSPDMLRIMVGCGAGAGIAGIFKAPIAGALYSIEVLHLEMSNPAILALLLAVMIASLTAYVLSGFTFDVMMDQSVPFDWHWLGWIALLGVVCGLYSKYYSYFWGWLGKLLGKIGNSWLQALASGAIISACLWLCPSLYGEGYGAVGKIINSDFEGLLSESALSFLHGAWGLIALAGLTMLLKAFACSATCNGGGVAGTFAPTLFAGCFVGLTFALAVNHLFGAHLIVGHFAFFGMAAVMGGIIGAPLMSIFLVCEMSGSFGYFLPVAICTAISMAIRGVFRL